jgi:hypothetical protein
MRSQIGSKLRRGMAMRWNRTRPTPPAEKSPPPSSQNEGENCSSGAPVGPAPVADAPRFASTETSTALQQTAVVTWPIDKPRKIVTWSFQAVFDSAQNHLQVLIDGLPLHVDKIQLAEVQDQPEIVTPLRAYKRQRSQWYVWLRLRLTQKPDGYVYQIQKEDPPPYFITTQQVDDLIEDIGEHWNDGREIAGAIRVLEGLGLREHRN